MVCMYVLFYHYFTSFYFKMKQNQKICVIKSYGITPNINTNPNLMKQIYIYGMWHYFVE